MLRTIKTQSLSNFELYNAVLLTIITMLCSIALEFTIYQTLIPFKHPKLSLCQYP